MKTKATLCLAILSVVCSASHGSDLTKEHISTLLMQSTFKIQSPRSAGTCFILGKPVPDNPKALRFTLVTAAHVLEAVAGDTATLVLRKSTGTNSWQRVEVPITIRSHGTNMWVKHPEADVAAMHLGLPDFMASIPLIPTGFLIDDDGLEKAQLDPGDELMCLGFPLGNEANAQGFPILRSGRIASYPLLPTRSVKTFLLDFEVFQGNSGGPVFMMERFRNIRGAPQAGNWQFLVGIISRQRMLTSVSQDPFRKSEENYSLGLGEVVHASLVAETIDMLGPKTE